MNLITYDWSLNLSFEEYLISSGFKACQFCIYIVTEC